MTASRSTSRFTMRPTWETLQEGGDLALSPHRVVGAGGFDRL